MASWYKLRSTAWSGWPRCGECTFSEACDPPGSSSVELVYNGLWYLCNIFCNVLGVGSGFLCAVPPFLRANGSLRTAVGLHVSIAARWPFAVFLPFIASIICFISLSGTWHGNLMFCLFFQDSKTRLSQSRRRIFSPFCIRACHLPITAVYGTAETRVERIKRVRS